MADTFPNEHWSNEVANTEAEVTRLEELQHYKVVLKAKNGYKFDKDNMPYFVGNGLFDYDTKIDDRKARQFPYKTSTEAGWDDMNTRVGASNPVNFVGEVITDDGGGTEDPDPDPDPAGVTNKVPNSVDKSTWDDIRETWYLKLVTASGYKFTGDIKASYINVDGNPITVTLEYQNNYEVWVFVEDADETTSFVITGETVLDNEMSVTNNVPNTTATGEKTGKFAGNVTLTANNGYKITSAKVKFTNGYGYPTTEDMSISEDGKTATWTNNDFEIDNGVTISGETVNDVGGDTPEVTVTNNMEGVLNETHTYEDDTLIITVESEHYSRFRFIDPKATYTDTDGQSKTVDMSVTVETDGSFATVTITDIDPNNPVTLTGRFVDVVYINQTLTNCIANPPLPEYVENGVPYTLSVTLQANKNTEFKSDNTPTFSYMDEDGHPYKKAFTISQDNKTATGEIDLGDWQDVEVIAEAYPVELVGQQHGSINVYLVTLDELEEFSKKRFVKGTEQGGAVVYEPIDLGLYVNRIRRIYTNIEAVSTDVIKCGDYNTGVTCLQPNTDKITLDFGTAQVPAHNEDNTDYESEVQVFLPFAGFVNLNHDYVGKTISLQYVINVITGNGVAKFSCDGVTFQVEEVRPNSEIIYLSPVDEAKTIGGDDWNEMLYYGLEPFIYCKWYEGVNSGRNNDRQTAVLSDLSGFNILDDVSPIHTPEMLTDEQEMIYRALSNGVYI